MERTHWGQHAEDCFGCKLQSLQFDPKWAHAGGEKSFVHLHNHTEYSALDGMSKINPPKKYPE